MDFLYPGKILTRVQFLLLNLIFIGIYFLFANLGLSLAITGTNASPVWPPSGLALAAILLYGRNLAPGIYVGAFLANIHQFGLHSELNWHFISASLFIAAGNTMEALVARWLIMRFLNSENFQERASGIFKFTAYIFLACGIAALTGCFTLYLSGIITSGLMLTVAYTWWLGDAAGILLFTPLLLSLTRQEEISVKPLERVLLYLVLILFSVFIFYFPQSYPGFLHQKTYMVLPFLLWAVFRLRVIDLNICLILISIIGITGINLHGNHDERNHELLFFQIYISLIAITVLSLKGAHNQLKNAERMILQANAGLEQKVASRTLELEKALALLKNEVEEKTRMEQAMKKFNEELKESNAELTRFAYVASHDLKTPLRSISMLVEFLENDLREFSDPDIQDKFSLIKAKTKKMNSLIDGILEYSKIGKEQGRPEEVDVKELVKDIINLISSGKEHVKFIVSEDLPVVTTYRTKLHQVFQNLLSNALKYNTSKDPEIEVGVNYKENIPEFFVRDNGPGIDKKYHDKIFEIFQTIQNTNDPEVTGIGLAIVKKIISDNKGKIMLESELGKGATFYFTWPLLKGNV